MREVVKIFVISLLCFFSVVKHANAQSDSFDGKKARKITYKEFKDNYSINDTSEVIIEIFFDKKDNTAIGEMVFLPITVGLAFVPVVGPIGAALTVVSLPLFLHGAYVMHRYRKSRLLNILVEYKKTGYLPAKIRKKAGLTLMYDESLELDY